MAGFAQLTGFHKAVSGRLAASAAVSVGDALSPNGTGELVRATAASDVIVGISLKKKASGDADYATVTETSILIPQDQVLFQGPVGNGTITEAIEGTFVDLHDADSLDVEASDKGHFFVVKAVPADNTAIGWFNSSAQYRNAAA